MLVQELEAAAPDAADPGRRCGRRSGRERGRDLDRRRPGGRLQDRVAQPSLGRRAVPGRRDRGRRDPSRHLHDGRPPDRRARRPPLRRPARSADAPPGRRRGAWRRRLRQLRRRADGRWRAGVRSDLRGQPAGQRDGDRVAARRAPHPGIRTGARQPRGPLRLGDRPRRDRGRLGPGQRDLHRRRPVQAAVSAGRRSVRREAADRGVARADRTGPGRGPAGPGCRRDHLCHVGDGRSGGDRNARRPGRHSTPRAGPSTVRGDDLGVAGAHVCRGSARPVAGGPGGLQPLGVAGGDHRARDRRRRHRGHRRWAGRPWTSGRRVARDRPHPRAGADQRRDRAPAAGLAPGASTGRPGPGRAGRRQRPTSRARHGPGGGVAGAARIGQPVVAPRRLPAVRLDGRGRHGGRSGSWCGRPPGAVARARRSSPRPTATSLSGSSIHGLGRRCRSRKRPGTCRSPARDRSA